MVDINGRKMSKRLRDNISSAYFEAANRLNSKSARRKIVAYVESYDDVFSGARFLVGWRQTVFILR